MKKRLILRRSLIKGAKAKAAIAIAAATLRFEPEVGRIEPTIVDFALGQPAYDQVPVSNERQSFARAALSVSAYRVLSDGHRNLQLA